MSRSELVQRLADANPQLYAKDCEAVVDAILGRLADAIAAGDRVEMRGCNFTKMDYENNS
ncbi:HU family DNA-binding protein [Methylobacterium sp. HMF5984]|uniref:HU family DNA-binding protein n=1 Tax=Methylobacterium sp. HMF5984 TaxID=3367370 RepID=UPI0038523DB8